MKYSQFKKLARKYAPVLILILLCVAFTALNGNFLSVRNLARIGLLAAPTLMIAIGVTFVVLLGSIDLSMEGVASFCAAIFAASFVSFQTLLPWGWLAIPLVLLLGFVIGLANGAIHVRLRIPSFMASLALGFVGLGATLLVNGGYRINVQDPQFRSLLTVRILEIPLMVYVSLAVLFVAWLIQNHTRLGRNIYAVGGGEELARAAGVNVDRVRILAFGLAGLFYAIGSVLLVARVGISDASTGSNQMFTAVTAVVVGGTSLLGGTGSVLNTLVGVLSVAVISNGMVVVGLPTYLQSGVLGVIVILAVAMSIDRKAISFVK